MKKFLLTTILIVAIAIRFWNLAGNPPHLTPDEAALGYNAYSILKTGRDEYGEFLPIIFKSFGDFKPGLYVYATVPFVTVFGLNEFSTRAASAVAGVVAVWLIYKITALLFKDKQYSLLPLFSAAALALSPWHIHFSRGAWEVNLSLTLTLVGIYYFLRHLEQKKYILHSGIAFALTLVTYQGAKLSTLIVILLLGLFYFKSLREKLKAADYKKSLLIAVLIASFIASPVLLSFTKGQTGRLKVFSVFSYRRPEEYLAEQLNLAQIEFGTPEYYLYYSENLNITRGIMGRWFNHFSGRFLFFEGDWANPRHSSPDHGEMLLADLVFLVVGLFAVAKTKEKGAKFFLVWLLLAPLPSALSRDQVHAVRALNMLIPLTFIASYGVYYTIKHARWRNIFVFPALVGLYGASLLYFGDSYFIHQPVHNSQYWEYGYKQVVETVTPIQNNYELVHVRQSFAQPYIYFLFFGGASNDGGATSSAYQNVPYDPATYQANAHLIESEYGDVGRVEELDNIRFWPIDWTQNRGDEGVLFVADPIRIPPEDSSSEKEFKLIKEIPYLDGKETSFRILEVLKRDEE